MIMASTAGNLHDVCLCVCCGDDVKLEQRLISTEFELHSVKHQLQYEQQQQLTHSRPDDGLSGSRLYT